MLETNIASVTYGVEWMCFIVSEWIVPLLQRLAPKPSAIGRSLQLPEEFRSSQLPKAESSNSTNSQETVPACPSSAIETAVATSAQRSSLMLQQKYRFVRHLGGGAFGAVVQAEDTNTGETVAVKKLQRLHYSPYFLTEILNHRKLSHPHVVRFHEVFLSSNHLNIVMEYANGGSLFDHVKKNRRLSEEKARWFFQQIMIAVDYCHRQGVANRDIKLENILLHCVPGKVLPIVKVCDWGYSKMAAAGPCTAVGTLPYMAPEVLQNCIQSQQQQYDGFAADIWSCGVVLYTMLVGHRPFDDRQGADMQLLQQMLNQQYYMPDALSPDCQNLVRRMLHPDAQQRIKMAEIQQHAWFQVGLPPGALDMCEKFLQRPCCCKQSEADIEQIVAAAAATEVPEPPL